MRNLKMHTVALACSGMIGLTSALQALAHGTGRKVMLLDMSDDTDEGLEDLASEVQKGLGEDSVVLLAARLTDSAQVFAVPHVLTPEVRSRFSDLWPPMPRCRDPHRHCASSARNGMRTQMLRPHRWGRR